MGAESMTENEFASVMQDISNAFRGKFAVKPDDSEEIKNDILTTWYKFFKDYKIEAFEEISRTWIEKEDKAPLIKDLKTKTRLLDERMRKAEKEKADHEEFIRTHDMSLGINDEGFEEDRAKHPFEEGWRITDEGYWVNRVIEPR
jgi:hypothetical protein